MDGPNRILTVIPARTSCLRVQGPSWWPGPDDCAVQQRRGQTGREFFSSVSDGSVPQLYLVQRSLAMRCGAHRGSPAASYVRPAFPPCAVVDRLFSRVRPADSRMALPNTGRTWILRRMGRAWLRSRPADERRSGPPMGQTLRQRNHWSHGPCFSSDEQRAAFRRHNRGNLRTLIPVDPRSRNSKWSRCDGGPAVRGFHCL